MSHVVIVGAGPAGASLSYLLVHRGIEVTLLERRRDFAREFRGEILMPSGIEALQEMGLTETFDSVASFTLQTIAVYMNGRQLLDEALQGDFLNDKPPMAISQPALLEALIDKASASPHFHFKRGVSVKELLSENGRIAGVRLHSDEEGEQELAADLIIGADGRNSVVRKNIGLSATEQSPPMDIVWCKLPCPTGWNGVRAYVGRGHLLVAYHTWDDTLQLGWVILKGTFGKLRDRGIDQWVDEMAHHVTPELAAHLRANAASVQKPFLLSVVSDCVDSWSVPGALLIGDAAHTMSPVGGQGLNIALRDAIVAANHLVPVLNAPVVDQTELTRATHSIETERMVEVQHIQNMQAQPPKLLLSRAWWGEPLRRIAAVALSSNFVRGRATGRVAAFSLGVTDVHLSV